MSSVRPHFTLTLDPPLSSLHTRYHLEEGQEKLPRPNCFSTQRQRMPLPSLRSKPWVGLFQGLILSERGLSRDLNIAEVLLWRTAGGIYIQTSPSMFC